AEAVLQFCVEPKSRAEIQQHLELKDREYLRKAILTPLIESGLLCLTLPDKPTSPKQKFYTAPADNVVMKDGKARPEQGNDNG
ncbi:MAG: hypothetical protein D6B28_02685, partial [Gammaproteobacteria bacterium]